MSIVIFKSLNLHKSNKKTFSLWGTSKEYQLYRHKQLQSPYKPFAMDCVVFILIYRIILLSIRKQDIKCWLYNKKGKASYLYMNIDDL